MEIKMFEKYGKDERIQLLKDNCYEAEILDYDKVITEEQKQAMEHRVFQLCREIEAKEQEKKELMKEIKGELDMLQGDRSALLRKISKGREEFSEQCYKFVEDGRAWYYNSDGEMVFDRPATPNECQTVMFGDFSQKLASGE